MIPRILLIIPVTSHRSNSSRIDGGVRFVMGVPPVIIQSSWMTMTSCSPMVTTGPSPLWTGLHLARKDLAWSLERCVKIIEKTMLKCKHMEKTKKHICKHGGNHLNLNDKSGNGPAYYFFWNEGISSWAFLHITYCNIIYCNCRWPEHDLMIYFTLYILYIYFTRYCYYHPTKM
jgi:hypothetical protein